jgi:hypothetical protein
MLDKALDLGLEGEYRLIEEAIRKAILEPQGTTSKGYFTVEDLAFWLIMLPNEHWTEDK